jgi:hypothetical protein
MLKFLRTILLQFRLQWKCRQFVPEFRVQI